MAWYRSLAAWIAKRGGNRKIYRTDNADEPNLYLERFYIIKTPAFEVMLHCFHLGDVPIMHDHPWDSVSVILETGYIEHVLRDGEDLGIFRSTNYCGGRKAEDRHWIELLPNTEGTVWSLFITGKRRKSWGFFTETGYVASDEHQKRTGVDTINKNAESYKGWLFPTRIH